MKKETEKQYAMDRANETIDNIKMKLMGHVSALEEAGAIRKARSLSRLVGELEHWQHTN